MAMLSLKDDAQNAQAIASDRRKAVIGYTFAVLIFVTLAMLAVKYGPGIYHTVLGH